MPIGPRLSIIIPTLNEAKCIDHTLQTLAARAPNAEIIVVDGESEDETVERASQYAQVMKAKRGRGGQLNAGVAQATCELLLFLHADTLPDLGGIEELLEVMSNQRIVGGAFRLRFDTTEPLYARIAGAVTRRSLKTKSYTGDQGIFTRKQIFYQLNGYRAWPFMEDVDYSERMDKLGEVILLEHEVETSARRHQRWGLPRTQLTVIVIRLLYLLKVPPASYAWLWPEVR